ncbi:MAG: branched-chain amino acid ABC transporter permease [Dehalococcoidales bacterium]|nr:branched-chain amino acid ABC transporter permease [Dehalococcoidales bacterium]
MLFGQLFVDGLAMGVVFVLLAAGLVLITSVSRILFMAYGIFYTIGAYTTWYATVKLDINYFLALIIGVLVSAVLAMLSHLLIFKHLQARKGAFLGTLIASMGLMTFLSQGNMLLYGTQSRGIPVVFPGILHMLGISITMDKVALIVISIVVTIVMFLIYEKTSIGRSLRAVAFLPEAAPLFGINTNVIYMLVLMMGVALAGFSGGLLAPTYGISPGMGSSTIWTVLLIMMLGGMDSLLGAVVGGLVVGQILSFGNYYIGSSVEIALFLIIGVLLFFRPQGLLGRGIVIES